MNDALGAPQHGGTAVVCRQSAAVWRHAIAGRVRRAHPPRGGVAPPQSATRSGKLGLRSVGAGQCVVGMGSVVGIDRDRRLGAVPNRVTDGH